MRKKTIILSVSAFFILAAGILFFVSRPLSLRMEQLFPSGALMYARLSHVTGDVDQFTQSVFWKNISTIDLPKVLEHNHTLPKDVQQLRQMQQDMEAFLKNPLTKEFLGKEVAVGFYPKIPVDTRDPLKSYDVLGATRLGLTFQIAQLFVSMAHQWSDDFTTTTENYHGFNIVHVRFKKRRLEVKYTRLRDVLLASFEPSVLLHQALDVYQKIKPSLALDPDFSKSIAHAYPKGHGIFYANVQGFYALLKNRIPPSATTSGFKSYTISFLPGDISKMKLILYFDAAQLDPHFRSMLSCTASANPSLNFVPHNVVAYQWGQCYDFNDLWVQMKEKMQLSPKTMDNARAWRHRLEKRFKLNLHDDVLPVLGSQVGGYLNDVDTQGLFPYPRAVVFVKIKDRLAAQGLMQKLTQNPLTLVQQEDYQQTPIRYITLPLGANMDLAYTFLGDYLLLATSRQLLKTSIDALNNPNQSLQSNETLKQFHLTASDLSQGMAFIKMDNLTGRLQQFLNWYNKIVSSQIATALAYQQESGARKKQLQEAVVSKKEELVLAQNKLKELQSKVAAQQDPSEEERTERQANIDHLSQQVNVLQEDVDSYYHQQQQLQQTLINYQNQSQSAKLWLFNSDEVLMPFLRGLEGLHALGMQLRLGDTVSETEIFIQ
ncbi:MAG: DUF3352 domain-containing protein [Candidatus Omnitrophica bacterium]|nr:DUF3352 domain-containing protein [Candidatus Omnitrophota bacterium]